MFSICRIFHYNRLPEVQILSQHINIKAIQEYNKIVFQKNYMNLYSHLQYIRTS